MENLALYVHFPYCPYKCHYCDFNSYAVPFDGARERAYLGALLSEMEFHVERLPSFRVGSVFLGGGTPSLFSPDSIGSFLTRLRDLTPFEEGAEITLEANPKTLDALKIDAYLKSGVNRLSIGVQSLKDRYLSPLGRLHSGDEAREILKLLQDKHLNFNADFMFGFPNQTVKEVLEDLGEAVQYSPRHLSFYQLTLEKGTRLYEEHRRGKVPLPENEVAAEMYERGAELLQERGYFLYEISNFAQKDYHSRHNLAYWRYRNYLGLGAGAVSFLRREAMGGAPDEREEDPYGCRWTNPRLPEDYLRYATQKNALPPMETIDRATAKGEFFMMGLRLTEGVSTHHFKDCFGEESFVGYGKTLKRLQGKGLLDQKDEWIRLTAQGRLLANEVVMEFLV